MTTDNHGGNIYKFNKEMLDFSANLNPLGMPEEVKEAVIHGIEFCESYPDPNNKDLREAISNKIGISWKNICCGNGGDDLIYRIAMTFKPKRALVVVPIFSEYIEALKLSECQIDYFYLKEEKGFVLEDGILEYIRASKKSYDMIVACSPNNPTGILIEEKTILALLELCMNLGIKCLLDECFMEFIKEKKEISLIKKIPDFKNLIILKSFTKIYAMAGIRLGYCICGNQEDAISILNCMQTWPVSTLASKAGIAALELKDWEEKTIEYIYPERKKLVLALSHSGYKVYEGKGNYIFFKSDVPLMEKFLDESIMIRSCQNYIGLNKGIEKPNSYYYRIAVRTVEENNKFIEALYKISHNLKFCI